MPPLSVMIKPVSGACNLACKYCFYADESANRAVPCYGTMNADTVRNLVRKAFIYADRSVSFAFQGGEPLLAGVEFYRKFISTVNSYNSRNLPVGYSVQTNATLLTDEYCSFFSENGFLVGVSLDGTEETHDANRIYAGGGGTYADVKRGIALLKKHRVEFNILCVLTNGLTDRIRSVWKELSEYGHLQFIPCIEPFGAQGTPLLSAEAYGKALVEIFDMYEKTQLTASPVRERRLDNYLYILSGLPPQQCGMAGGCGISFLCEADGSIFPCDFYALDEWKLGNINETSFARMENGETMQSFLAKGLELPSACRECKYLPICRGGCKRDREPDNAANRFCESYKYFFDNRIDKMQMLAKRICK